MQYAEYDTLFFRQLKQIVSLLILFSYTCLFFKVVYIFPIAPWNDWLESGQEVIPGLGNRIHFSVIYLQIKVNQRISR